MAEKKPKPEEEIAAWQQDAEYWHYEGYDAEGNVVRVARVAVSKMATEVELKRAEKEVADAFYPFTDVVSYKLVSRTDIVP